MNELFKQYNEYVEGLCSNIKDEVEKALKAHKDSGGKIYLCAISRKTPKLLDIWRHKLAGVWDKLKIVTEIALPFLEWNDIRIMLLVDDAIYYGSTFTSVYNLIRKYSPETKVVPLCCIKAAETSLVFDNDLKAQIGPRALGHYFVNSLGIDFRKQCTPFEVEFPVFEIELGQDVVPMCNELLSSFREINNNTYIIDNGIDTYLDAKEEKVSELGMDYSKNGEVCRKIRFYLKGEKILASSIYAYTIAQISLFDDTLFGETVYDDLWKFIVNKVLTKERDEDACRSLCIAINFIYSMDAFFRKWSLIKGCIEDAYKKTDVKFSVSEREVGLLFGDTIRSYFTDWLKWNSIEEVAHLLSEIGPEQNEGGNREYLPEALSYKGYYHTVQERFLKKNGSVAETLDGLFYVQNCMLDKMNRPFFQTSNKRLKYGHTFGSLKRLLNQRSKPGEEDGDDIELHKWVDARIDSATVVPQYIKTAINDSQVWVRVFRSGENEIDFISHWVRLCAIILKTELQASGLRSIDKRYFSSLISLVFNKYKLAGYFYGKPSCKHQDYCYQMMLSENSNASVIDRLQELEVVTVNHEGRIALNEDFFDEELLLGSILPEKMMDEICDYITHLPFPMHTGDPDYYMAFFEYYLHDYASQKDSDVIPVDSIFQFLKQFVEEKKEITDDVLLEFSLLRNNVICAENQKRLREMDWGTNVQDCEDSTFEDEVAKLKPLLSKSRIRTLLELIGISIINGNDNGKKLVAFLKDVEIPELRILSSQLAGLVQNKKMNVAVFNAILSKGKHLWTS